MTRPASPPARRSRTPARTSRRGFRFGLAAAVGALAVGLSATPAAALELESASPGGGDELKSSPAEVVLTFDGNVAFGSAEIAVEGPDGSATEGLTFSFGTEVRQRLRPSLPDGRYTVEYRVDSGFGGDGDRGDFTFRIARSAAPPTTPPPTRKPSPTPTETEAERDPQPRRTKIAPAVASGRRVTEPVETAEPTNVPAPQVAGVASTRDEWLPPPVFWWFLFALLAVGGYRVLQWRRRHLAAAEAAEVDAPPGMPEPVLAPAGVVAPRQSEALSEADTNPLPPWTSRRDRRAYPPAEATPAPEPASASAGVATETDASGPFQAVTSGPFQAAVPSAWSREPTGATPWPGEPARGWSQSQHGATASAWSQEPNPAWPPPGSSPWPAATGTSAWSGAQTPPADT